MQFITTTSPHSARIHDVNWVMSQVILALLPGILAMTYLFGWGVLINIVLATMTALLFETVVLYLRQLPIMTTLHDLSAVVTALLLALALPPILPWWLTVLGVAFAILIAKHIYGGLGYNPFNPAMLGYVFLLVSYPAQMTTWLAPSMLAATHLSFTETATLLFTGTMPIDVTLGGGISPTITLDAITAATPLEVMRTGLRMQKMVVEIRCDPMWGYFGGRGFELVNSFYALGGLWMLYRRVISWRIPVSLLVALYSMASFFYILDVQRHPSPIFHILSGGAMLGAFFIATDPVTASTTPKGQLIYGAAIGMLIFIIRTWGGYPDAVAFAVLLLNMAVPIIDHYTQPRVFGVYAQVKNT